MFTFSVLFLLAGFTPVASDGGQSGRPVPTVRIGVFVRREGACSEPPKLASSLRGTLAPPAVPLGSLREGAVTKGD